MNIYVHCTLVFIETYLLLTDNLLKKLKINTEKSSFTL